MWSVRSPQVAILEHPCAACRCPVRPKCCGSQVFTPAVPIRDTSFWGVCRNENLHLCSIHTSCTLGPWWHLTGDVAVRMVKSCQNSHRVINSARLGYNGPVELDKCREAELLHLHLKYLSRRVKDVIIVLGASQEISITETCLGKKKIMDKVNWWQWLFNEVFCHSYFIRRLYCDCAALHLTEWALIFV